MYTTRNTIINVVVFGAVGVLAAASIGQRPNAPSSEPPKDRVERRERGGDDGERQRRPAAERDGDARIAPQYLPPRPNRDWLLGVYAESTSKGVLITRVVPGTAAARAGLERDDVIITVDGYQVGRVNRTTYDLGDELQLRANSRGEVLLLVHNHRDNRLVNVDARLTPRAQLYRERDRERSPRGLEANRDDDELQ